MNITKLPNIILIVCDTLSAKHMSLYGYDRRTTPNLERLVEEKGFTVYEIVTLQVAGHLPLMPQSLLAYTLTNTEFTS